MYGSFAGDFRYMKFAGACLIQPWTGGWRLHRLRL